MGRVAEEMREKVFRANRELAESGLVMGTFGNVSAVDRDAGVMVIKPSGVPYRELSPGHMVAVSLASGEVVDSGLRPSSDTPTHLELYRAFSCGGVVHTHSEHATTLAQAGLPVRCMGTTHADHFRGDIPVTRVLTRKEIVETFRARKLSPEEIPAALVVSHGPFAWGPHCFAAVENARLVEYLARMEIRVRLLAAEARPPEAFLIDKHFLRKHGKGAYYGQR
jgi:L-ribulose-5-phosphate 4-epimerase